MPTYWICQLLGWFAYSAVGIIINLLNGAKPAPLLLNHAFFIAFSIGSTHLLRREIRRRGWPHRTIRQMLPVLAAGVLLISLGQVALVVTFSTIASGVHWERTALAALWWGMLLATGVWAVLYVRFTERRFQAAREDRLQLALREAELRALESQINPHFLFNCLNSIRALVTVDPPRAQEMLTRLSNVMRNSLRRDRGHTVQLASEVEVVADYLALEAIRFEERMQTRIVVDERAAECMVPPMLLQTLAENAVKHGIAHVSGTGEVAVEARLEDRALRIVVENTGQLTRSGEGSGRMGLANIRERLQLLYGGAAELEVRDSDKGRVRAAVSLPVEN